jgi:two-component system NtrC family sensor kinase
VEIAVASLEETFRKGGVDIVRDYDPSLPHLFADEEKMRRVFNNLLMNSFQAMKEGGRITVKTEYDKEKNGVRIIFSDTGSGIPENLIGKIFEPFFTTKPTGQGTGLGLAVSYGIVKEHGGEISVESEEGAGTSFTLWFPLDGDKV